MSTDVRNTLDVRTLMTGNDGKLFIYNKEKRAVHLAEVKDFEIKATFGNVDYQPLGDLQEYTIPSKVKYTLTFSCAVVRDDLTLEPIIESLKKNQFPVYDFQSTATRTADGMEQQITLRNCVPTGDFDIMTLKAGEVIMREQTFIINSTPELNKVLTTPWTQEVYNEKSSTKA